jgi:hypothetical protein
MQDISYVARKLFGWGCLWCKRYIHTGIVFSYTLKHSLKNKKKNKSITEVAKSHKGGINLKPFAEIFAVDFVPARISA